MSLGIRSAVLLAFVGLVVAPRADSCAEDGARLTGERVAVLARSAFQAALERVDRLSFNYRHVKLGELPIEAGLAEGTPGISGFSVDVSKPWSTETWEKAVRRAATAWPLGYDLQSAELVRAVRRSGSGFLDVDLDLLRERKLIRPTAGAEWRTPGINCSWLPLMNRVTVGGGDTVPGGRPNARYFFTPTMLSQERVHRLYKVSCVDRGAAGWRIEMSHTAGQNAVTYRYDVRRELGWLPVRSATINNGRVTTRSVFEWADVVGVGIVPAAVARVRGKRDRARLSLSSFWNFHEHQGGLGRLSIPPGTQLEDHRHSPVTQVRADTRVGEPWSAFVSIGSELPIPKEFLTPKNGAQVPEPRRASR